MNIDARRIALTAIEDVGRRYSHVVCRKADVDINKRAGDSGEVSDEVVDKLITFMSNPQEYKVRDWFLASTKNDKYSQVMSNILDTKFCDDLEHLKKIRAHCGFRQLLLEDVGRRYSHVVCRKADVDINKRAGDSGEVSDEVVDKLITFMSNPQEYEIQDWIPRHYEE